MKINQTYTGLLASGLLAVTCSLAATPANAATLAQYGFTGNSPASTDTNTGSVASNFGGGPGMEFRISGFRGDPVPSVAIKFSNLKTESKAAALSTGSYYNFNIAPVSGQKLQLTSFSFDTNVGPVAQPSEVNATGSFFARFSSDGVNFTDIGQTYTQTQTPPPNGNVDFVTRNVDLSGINSSFFTAPVYFRIYEYKNGSNDSVGGLRIDNVNVQGNVSPVPELSTGILFAIAMMGMGAFALRRKGGLSFSAPKSNGSFAI